MTLRELLIQRSARLQEYPALTAAPWGQLRYPAFRNRVEGVALGLMTLGGESFHIPAGGPWAWACEVACACCGLRWEPGSPEPDPEVLGGRLFNDEASRQAYHDRDHDLLDTTPFTRGLSHGDLLQRLRRLNNTLGWDHRTAVPLPMSGLPTLEVRAALWSALYAGGHAILKDGPWDPTPFRDFWSE